MFKLATCEPYSNAIHGEGPSGHYLVIYDYLLKDFYNNEWIDETEFYIKKTLKFSTANNYTHETIRNYKNIIKQSNKMQLVESVIDPVGRELCIIHTYKINIIKRLWKKKHINLNIP